MNIRRIIKEELGDFDWVRGINYLEGDCYELNLGILNKPQRLTVSHIEGNDVIFTTPIGDSQPISLEWIRQYTEAGTLTPCKNIKEDFDWVNDTDILEQYRGKTIYFKVRSRDLKKILPLLESYGYEQTKMGNCDEYQHQYCNHIKIVPRYKAWSYLSENQTKYLVSTYGGHELIRNPF